MTENKNANPKREVPVLTLEEYKMIINEGKRLPKGNFKIAEKDKDRFLKDVTMGEEGR